MNRSFLLVVLALVAVAAFSVFVVGAGDQSPAGQDEVLPPELQGRYPDGRYRGTFHDHGTYLGPRIGMQEVGIQFHLEDNQLYDLSYRVLAWRGDNYRVPDDPNNEWPEEDLIALKEQHEQLLEYLEGRDISEVDVLYTPEVAAEDVEGSGELLDVWTAATMRANKVLSAIRDGLNRGVYVPAD